MNRQIYCTALDVIEDLGLRGFEDGNLMDWIRGASQEIVNKYNFNNFIPVTETRYFGKPAERTGEPLDVSPLLAVTSITSDDVAVTEYDLKPYNKMWPNGPYIEIEQDDAWGEENDVVIVGKWGKYEETRSTGATISQTTTSETTLVVTDGSLICPGMVLLIESEQEYVSEGLGSKNSPAGTAATSLVNGAIDENDVSIVVDNGAEFHAGEVIQIGVEDMKILKINTHTLAVERGWNGTAPADHLNDAAINVYRTFTVERGVNGTTAATHSSKAVSQYLVPDTVNYLCRQIAALMRMKAASGFTGITGSAEQGQGRYLSEFPQKTISEVLDPFRIWSE